MTGIVDWAGERARMVIAFIVLSLLAGGLAYVALPKEGEPDIEIPAVFVSVPFPGISAEDSEKLLVKPMETELSDLDGLKSISGTASEGYAGVALEFEFGWDKTKIIADIRDRMNTAEASFPVGGEQYSINEINFSEFPIIIVNLTGAVPERTLLRVAKSMQDRLEGLEPVLEAALAGHRDEMLEVLIDPLRLEAYNVTAGELIAVVQNNNQLIAAGEVETAQGTFSVKIPGSFDNQRDIYDLPIKVNGDRVVTLGDLAHISLTFEDRTGTARFNGETTVALQVVKRKGFNLIDTAAMVRAEVEKERETWSDELKAAVRVGTSNDQSFTVDSMVGQLEGSVLTAIALVMIVVLAALGTRSALLVGFAIPTSFLMTFALFAVMDVTVSNIVMFGLILAVGMLVDGAVVVVEYADRRIQQGVGPMHAYVEAAKRMFWPIAASTGTTLCAFLPMLFWPGVPGEFMGMLPVTMIFVLIASFIVAIVFLPVMGGVAGRISRKIAGASQVLRRILPVWILRLALVPPSLLLVFVGAMQALNPDYIFGFAGIPSPVPPNLALVPGVLMFILGAVLTSITMGAVEIHRAPKKVDSGHKRTLFGWVIKILVANPVMPIVAILAIGFIVMSTFSYFGTHNKGVEFFVDSEPEQAIVYVRARGNLSLTEKDALVREVEKVVLSITGLDSVFSFAGEGGLNSNTGGSQGPLDSIGQVQIELVRWENRPSHPGTPWLGFFETRVMDDEYDGNLIIETLENRLAEIPGIQTEVLNLSRGPGSGKPVHLRLKGENWDDLLNATEIVRDRFADTEALIDIEDTRPLPGIDWQIDVDVEKAGRFGADVAVVGGMVQLVTRGILLDTMRVPSSDEEIEIRVRLPEEDRVLSTLDTLKVRTPGGLVPLSNFISRKAVPKLGQIDRVDQDRYFDIKADVSAGMVTLGTGTGETRVVMATARDPNATGGATLGRVLSTLKSGDTTYDILNFEDGISAADLQARVDDESLVAQPVNANERIAYLTEWLGGDVLPRTVAWEWTGDQEDQAESMAFLVQAFAGALGLMFIILLAQFNSFYNAVLVLLAVVLSTTGVLIGMLVMDQAFSIIMTGTGIVALAGIVVNNNIVLIDTYQEYARYMPRIEAIIRTAEDRIRPVLLTTITTMAGLTPMMFGLSLDFIGGGYSIDSPTALWWKQLATAVVFGLGIATVLTLVFTPSMLALRVWIVTYAQGLARLLAWLSLPKSSRIARDWALKRSAKRVKSPQILWDAGLPDPEPEPAQEPTLSNDESLMRMLSLRAAE